MNDDRAIPRRIRYLASPSDQIIKGLICFAGVSSRRLCGLLFLAGIGGFARRFERSRTTKQHVATGIHLNR